MTFRNQHIRMLPSFALALALTLGGPSSAFAEPPSSTGSTSPTEKTVEEKALEQQISDQEQIAHGHVAIDQGHVDIGPKFVDGQWKLMIHDDHDAEPVWRSPEDVVLKSGDAALLPKPEDAAYDFVQANPGDEVYVVPQTEKSGVVWPGWNTQDPETERRLGTGGTLSMEGVEGPGQFSLYLENGNFAGPQVLWNSADDAGQDIWVPKNSHTHANWVFTRPGVYFVTVRAHAKLADGTEVSDTQRLQFAVGDSTDVESVFARAKALGEPKPASQADASSGASAGPSSGADKGTDTATMIMVGAGSVILLGGGIAFWVSARGRRAKEAASVEERRP